MTEQEVRELAPEVFVPTDDDYDPYRVIRDAEWHAKVMRGVAAATDVQRHWQTLDWWVSAMVGTHKRLFIEPNLAAAFAALADAIDKDEQDSVNVRPNHNDFSQQVK